MHQLRCTLLSGRFITSYLSRWLVSVATSEQWKDKQTGEKKEQTEWHRVVIFGKLAEVAGEYLRKGSQVYIEGQLRTRKWSDSNGVDRYTTEIVIPQIGGVMQMLGGKRDDCWSATTPAIRSTTATTTAAAKTTNHTRRK